MLGDDEVGQHVIPTNLPGPQESNRDKISVLGKYDMVSDMYERKEENQIQI